MRMGVVTNVVHYAYADGLYAYGPYARELDVWAALFEKIVVLGPCRNGLLSERCGTRIPSPHEPCK